MTLKNDGNLVICTLQKTPIDEFATLILHTKVDEILKKITDDLNIKIPIYKNTKKFNISFLNKKLKIETIEGFGCSFIDKIKIENKILKFPFDFESNNDEIEIEIYFIENYSQKLENMIIGLKNNEKKQFSVDINYFDFNTTTFKRKDVLETRNVKKKLKIEK